MLKIYKASAGSGKTYTLAYEYIHQLLGVKDAASVSPSGFRLNHPHYAHGGAVYSERHRHILAITFTNKATEEMKRRIVNELKALSEVPAPGAADANYAARLCQELQCTREHLAQAAAKALTELLCDYGFFHVTTIDSFFQRVLRTFARELDRPGDFNIELEDSVAVNAAVETMLADFNINNRGHRSLEHWLYMHLTKLIDEGQKSNFFNRGAKLYGKLIELVGRICDEQFKEYMPEMRAYLSDMKGTDGTGTRLDAYTRALDAAVKAQLQRMQEACSAFIQAATEIGYDESRFQYKNLYRAIARMAEGRKPLAASLSSENIAKAEAIVSGEKSPNKKRADDPAIGELYRQTIEHVLLGMYPEYRTMTDLQVGVSTLWLLAHAWVYIDSFVAENNTVLISDTNHLLQRIIGADETPFVYERMGVDLRHFLIDEFQDTSRMQWKNLKPLLAESLSVDYDNLIIGDEKQSIYRFRNSDSTLLHSEVAQEDFPVPDYNTRVSGDAPGENTNYRSASHIVRFNNTLFKALAASLGVEGYENVVQEISPKHLHHDGYVQVLSMENDDMMARLVENIVRQHDEGGYQWRDIAVLTPKNGDAAKVIEYIDTHRGDIPVLSDEALYISRSTAVQSVVSVLRMLAGTGKHTKDKTRADGISFPDSGEIAMMVSRYVYFVGQGIDAVEALDMAVSRKPTPEQEALTDKLGELRHDKAVSIPALIEMVISRHVPEEDRRRQAAYLAAFQDYAVDYCSRYAPTLRAFVAHWERQDTLAMQSSADLDAVRVMTIHKSKGLEFDCVHIPFGGVWTLSKPIFRWVKTPEIAGIDPKIAPTAMYVEVSSANKNEHGILHDVWKKEYHEKVVDMLNRTYVAYTRAGVELAIYYEPKGDFGKILTETLANAAVTAADDGEISTLCNLREFYDPVTKTLVYGKPTFRDPKDEDADKNPEEDITVRLDQYRVYHNAGTRVLTEVDDALELGEVSGDGVDGDAGEGADSISAGGADEYADEHARERGILLHDVLSRTIRLADLPRAVQLTRLERRLDADAAAELQHTLEDLLDADDELVRRWFVDNAGVYTEQAVYDPETAREYRPDRLVCHTDGSVDVVDYKFTTTQRKAHRRQVAEYVRLLERMGYGPVNGYLWYPLIDNVKQKV